MGKPFTRQRLRRYYRLMSAPMMRFDCGRLCAPGNKGLPACCDHAQTIPVLYRAEYKAHRKDGRFWRKYKPASKRERRMADELGDACVFAVCPGPGKCRRDLRALVCRMFPFEPYLDANGTVLGLVYQQARRDRCPLVGKPPGLYNRGYIRNSMRFWRELLARLPDERDLYIEQSRKLRKRWRKKGKRFRLIRA